MLLQLKYIGPSLFSNKCEISNNHKVTMDDKHATTETVLREGIEFAKILGATYPDITSALESLLKEHKDVLESR